MSLINIPFFRLVAVPFLLLWGLLVTPLTSLAVDFPTGVTAEELTEQLLWKAVGRLPLDQRPKIILVLGGGGAKGLSHIGVLRVFEEEHIPIDSVVGVSVGALIGSLVAAGLSVDAIDSMAKDVGWENLTNYSKVNLVKMILAEDLISTQRMETYLHQRIGQKDFSQLEKPFVAIATDLRTAQRVVLDDGPVAVAARASATIPGIFAPVPYRQRYLVDGGVVDNLPTDVIKKGPYDIVVGVLPKAENQPTEESLRVFMVLLRTIEIQRDIIIRRNRKEADFLIEPNVQDITIADLGRSRECIEIGLLEARSRVKELKKLIFSRTLQFLKNEDRQKEAQR